MFFFIDYFTRVKIIIIIFFLERKEKRIDGALKK